MKFEKPGIKTKEGLQTTGTYTVVASILLYVVVPYFFPEVDIETVVGAANEVREAIHAASESTSEGSGIKDLLLLYASGHILNGKRSKSSTTDRHPLEVDVDPTKPIPPVDDE